VGEGTIKGRRKLRDACHAQKEREKKKTVKMVFAGSNRGLRDGRSRKVENIPKR